MKNMKKMVLASGRVTGTPRTGMVEGDRYVAALDSLESLARCGAIRVVHGLVADPRGGSVPCYEVWETHLVTFDPDTGSISSKIALDEYYT